MKTDEKSLSVRQSNTLIEASYKIPSIGEGRLIRMLIAQIQPTDEDFKTYRISVTDFARFFGLSESNNSVYELVDKAAEALAHRPITIRNGKSWLHTNWLSSAEYLHGSGYVELCFDKKLKPYLLQLKEHFTQYELEKVVTFKSGYSMRLFELLKMEQFKALNGKFRRAFEYEELRKKLGVEKSEYRFFKDFRVNVVEVAIREINSNPDLNIAKVDYEKTGRKVTHIAFFCEKPKKKKNDVDAIPPKAEGDEKKPPEDVREMVALGIDEATAYKWRRKYGVGRVKRNIGYTKAMKNAGQIRESVPGFLASAIANNSGGPWAEEEERRKEAQKAREREEQEAKSKEADVLKKKAQRREKLEADFNSLSPEDRGAVRDAFEAQLKGAKLQMWRKAKTAHPDNPEQDTRATFDFFTFFESWPKK